MAEPHHHPPSHTSMHPQQQGAPTWYPNTNSSNPQFQFQNHQPLQQYPPPSHHPHAPLPHLHPQQQQQHQHNVPLPLPDRRPPPYHQPHIYYQPDYYSQQTSHPMPSQAPQSQFTFPYAQQEQVRPMNTGWGYRQWEYRDPHEIFNPEEDWAGKARAWAAAKAAMDSAAHTSSSMHRNLQNYQQQEPQPWLNMPHTSLNPPGEDALTDNTPNPVLKVPNNHVGQPLPTAGLEHGSDSMEQRFASGHFQEPSHNSQVLSSSCLLDGTSTVGQENSPAGIERKDSASEHSFHQPSTTTFNQQPPRFLPPGQVHPEPYFSYHETLPSATNDYHVQQHLGMQEQLPQNFHQHPQFGNAVLPAMLERPEADTGIMTSNSVQNWPPLEGPHLPYPAVTTAVITGSPQFERSPSIHPPHHLAVSQSPMFGRPYGAQAAVGFLPDGPVNSGLYGFGVNSPLASGPGGLMFIPDGNSGLGFPERPKKAAVPSWLREELLKKKAAGLTGTSAGTLASEDSNIEDGDGARMTSISYRTRPSSPGLSDNDTDEREDEIEVARNAAINQEIKRVLTDVLLKVTGDLFDEIAQEVLEENSGLSYAGDDQNGSVKLRFSTSSTTPISPNTADPSVVAAAARVVISTLKDGARNSRSDNASVSSDNVVGNVLGLANYASDEEEVELRKETERNELSQGDKAELKNGHVSEDTSDRKSSERDYVEVKVKEYEDKKGVEVDSGEQDDRENAGIKGTVNIDGDQRSRVFHREKSRGCEVRKFPSNETKRSPEFSQSPEHESVDYKNSERGGYRKKSSVFTGENRNEVAGKSTENKHLLQSDVRQAETEKNSSRNMVSQSAVADKECRKTESRLQRGTGIVEGKEKEVSAKSGSKVISNTSHKRERETRGLITSSKIHHESSGKEKKKRDGKASDSNARKSGDEKMGNRNALDEHDDKEKTRKKQKEKMKEKAREREKQHVRDYKRDEKQTSERRGREKRTSTASTRRSRCRSSSSSSRGSRSGSSSSSESRRRQHARRSSKRVSRSRSPGRSRKRRVSRSRSRSGSRSRSPHVKQFRRNSSSLSRDKSRYRRSRSSSPVHRRRRS